MNAATGKSRVIKHSSKHLAAAGVTRSLTIMNLPRGVKISVDGVASDGTSNTVIISNASHLISLNTSPAKSISVAASDGNVNLDFNSSTWSTEGTGSDTRIDILGPDGVPVTPSGGRFTHHDGGVDSDTSPYASRVSYRINYSPPLSSGANPKYALAFDGNIFPPSDFDNTFVSYSKNISPSTDVSIIVYDASGDIVPDLSGIAVVPTGRNVSIVNTEGAQPSSVDGFFPRIVMMPKPSNIPSDATQESIRNSLRQYFGSSVERISDGDLRRAHDYLMGVASGHEGRAWGSALYTAILRVKSSSAEQLRQMFSGGEVHGSHPTPNTSHEDHDTKPEPHARANGTVIIRGVGSDGSVSLTPQSGHRHDSSSWRFDDVSPGSYVVTIAWNDGKVEHHDLRVEEGGIVDAAYGRSYANKNDTYATPVIGIIAGMAILGGVEWLKKNSQG